MKIIYTLFSAALFFFSCNTTLKDYDASGAFESVETIISTEAAGTIKEFNIEEGQTLEKGILIGYIDTMQLYLRRKQLEAQIDATIEQKPNIPLQIAAFH